METEQKIWIGIDQTGATRDGGKTAVPLPMAWVRLGPSPKAAAHSQTARPCLEIHVLTASLPGKTPRLLSLPALDPESLLQTLQASSFAQDSQRSRVPRLSSETLLLLDCVLGLPRELLPARFDFWTLLARAAEFTDGFGRGPAERFFAELLATLAPELQTPPFPTRRIERALRANSVFRTRPYQKNIQTGTYRMWRELGRNPGWLTLWPLESARAPQKPIALEGYPSYLWQSVFGQAQRAPEACVSIIEQTLAQAGIEAAWCSADSSAESLGGGRAPLRAMIQELMSGSPDHADALILAVGAFLLDRAGALFPKEVASHPLRNEGWIAGAPIDRL